MMLFKKAIVWVLVGACTAKDKTVAHFLPLPDSWLEKDWTWLDWVYTCRLATISSYLDERWNTNIWSSLRDS